MFFFGGTGIANTRIPHTLTVIETPAAGTYTYDIEVFNTNSIGNIIIQDANLLLFESAV